MGIKEDYQAALEAAKQGDLKTARKLLIPHKGNSKVDAALTKINEAILREHDDQPASKPEKKSKRKEWKDLTVRERVTGVVSLVVIFLCLCALLPSIFNGDGSSSFEDGTLEGEARAAVASVFGRDRANEIDRVIVNDQVVTLRFPLTDLSASSMRFEGESRFPELICELRERGLTGRTYQITGTITLIDSLGNESIGEGIETIIAADMIASINCDADSFYINLPVIAERYDIHPAIREN